MRAARDGADFLQAPLDSFLLGRRFLYFCLEAGVSGCLFWGHPDESDVDLCFHILDGLRDVKLGPFVSVIDSSRLEGVAPGPFKRFHDGVATHMVGLQERIRKQALIRPAGLPGAVVAGFYRVVEPPFPVEVFTNIHDAAVWLGDGTAGSWTTELAELWKRVLSDRPEVRQVRALIGEDLVHATLDGAARALGVSPRTLQRQLQDAGTSFVSELTAARIAAAQAKMRSTDLKLTAIALEIGCSSLQHFSGLFRRETGLTPSAWRRKEQSGATL